MSSVMDSWVQECCSDSTWDLYSWEWNDLSWKTWYKVKLLESCLIDKIKMIESLSIQQLDVEIQIDETIMTTSKLSLGDQCIDEMLKIRKSYDDMRGLGYIDKKFTNSFPSLFLCVS